MTRGSGGYRSNINEEEFFGADYLSYRKGSVKDVAVMSVPSSPRSLFLFPRSTSSATTNEFPDLLD